MRTTATINRRRVARRRRAGGAGPFERLEPRLALAVSPALLNSWFVSGQGEFAKVYVGQPGGAVVGPSTTWTGQTTPVLGDVQKVSASTTTNTVYVNTPDLASYVMGAWWGNAAQTQPFINLPKDQNSIYKITLTTTYPQTTHGVLGGGAVALAVNGVVIYNAGDAFSYSHASGTDVGMTGDGLFNRMAEAVESVTFDAGNGHQPGNGQYHYHTNPVALRAQLSDNVDYIGTTNYFPYDPAVYYLTHGEGTDGEFREHTADLHHSPIIGWMFDGYPIYGPYGYSSPTDPTSAVERMQSSFALRSITDRTTLPGWAAQIAGGKLGPAATNTAADGVYTMTTQQQSQYAGPAVSATYPLGRYGEDYAYVPGSGDLDQFCGRWCKTPEFPNGTYAYFLPIDAAGNPVFPFIVNRQMYGQPNGSGKVTSITEAVTVAFNVATNTAPVVAGPASLAVAHGGTATFTGGSAIRLSDVDEAAVESVALAVSAGSLNLDLTGPLAGRVSVTSGANHASAVTISGAVDELNAALATLTFTAPSSGLAATLTVQANDGSAANNLSGTLTTAITLVNVLPTAAWATIASPRNAAVSSVGISFSEAVTGLDATDLRLTRNGTTVSLAGASISGSGGAWTVGNLGGLTAADGAYVLSLVAAGSGIVDADGGGLAADASVAWTMDTSVTVAAGQTVTSGSGYSGSFQLVKRGAGRLVLTAPSTHTGGTVIEAGEVVIRDPAALGTGLVSVQAGGRLMFDVGGGTVALTALAVDSSGLVDLGASRMTIAASGVSEATLRAWIAAGRGDGSWNGTSGVACSSASGVAGFGIGYVRADDGGFAAALAIDGDTNLDGTVDMLDIANVASSGRFETGIPATWQDGDVNYDDMVDIVDISAIIGSGSLALAASDAPPTASTARLAALDAVFAALAADATPPPARQRPVFAIA